MQHLAMRVIGMALFSRDLQNDLQAGLAQMARAAPRGARGANCFTETVRAVVQAVALRNLSPAPLPLANLVRSYGDQAAAADTRRELRDQVVTLFFAGFETTAAALAWT